MALANIYRRVVKRARLRVRRRKAFYKAFNTPYMGGKIKYAPGRDLIPSRVFRPGGMYPAPRAFPVSIVASRFQKMRFVHTAILEVSSGAINTQFFRANSVYLPIAAAGYYPMKYNELAALYNKYCVVSSTIRVERIAIHPTDATAVPTVWGIILDDNSTLGVGKFRALIERGRTVHAISNNTSAMAVQKLGYSFNAKTWFNVADPLSNNEICGVVGSPPSNISYFVLWLQTMDLVSSSNPTSFLVTVDYDVVWSDPKDTAPSSV